MNLAAIHIQKNKAGLSDQQYRQLLLDCAGVNSSKQLDETGYKAVMKELYSMTQPTYDPNVERSPQEKKIWALWYELRELLPEQERTPRYLFGIIKRVAGVEKIRALSELSSSQMHKCIEALKRKLDEEIQKQQVPF